MARLKRQGSSYRTIGKLFGVSSSTVLRRLRTDRDKKGDGFPDCSTTIRHSYARHPLLHGDPIDYVSRSLGHRSIQTTLVVLVQIVGW